MSQATQIEQNKELASRAFTEIISERNFDVLDDVFTEDYVQHDSMHGEMRGSAALQEWFEQVHAGFSDFEATQEFSLAEDDLVASLVTYSGTHDGEFMGIPASGEHVTISSISIFRFEDGKITEAWVEVDNVGLLQQVGAMDAPSA
jgi:steroid delta-isomerase-like uncharacterized protein